MGSDAVVSSDEETETVTIDNNLSHLTVAGSGLYGKDKCRKSLKLTSDQLVSFSLVRLPL